MCGQQTRIYRQNLPQGCLGFAPRVGQSLGPLSSKDEDRRRGIPFWGGQLGEERGGSEGRGNEHWESTYETCTELWGRWANIMTWVWESTDMSGTMNEIQSYGSDVNKLKKKHWSRCIVAKFRSTFMVWCITESYNTRRLSESFLYAFDMKRPTSANNTYQNLPLTLLSQVPCPGLGVPPHGLTSLVLSSAPAHTM